MESEVALALGGIGRSDSEGASLVDHSSAAMLYKAISEQLSGDLGGEAVILSLKTGKYYGLNILGARIWALLQDPMSLESLEEAILAEFDVDPDECHTEVTSFVDLLKSEGLIESIDGRFSEIHPPDKGTKGPAD